MNAKLLLASLSVWMEGHLRKLSSRGYEGAAGAKGNAWAVCEVPDWDMKQRLSEVDSCLEDLLTGAGALAGARSVGERFPISSPQGVPIPMYVVSVHHPNGEWEAIYCKTKDQAEAIEKLAGTINANT